MTGEGCLGVELYLGTTSDVLMVYEWVCFFWGKMPAKMYSNLCKMCNTSHVDLSFMN